MVKRIELGTSCIVPKGLLGYYITPLFWLFEEKRVKPFVHFDKHTFYTMCRKDWEWGKIVLTNIMQDLRMLIVELGTNEHTHECAIIYTYINRIREIRNILDERAVERPIYAYIKD
jgi:hypothetical protein